MDHWFPFFFLYTMEVSGINSLVILINIFFCVQQTNNLRVSKWQKFYFGVNYPVNKTIWIGSLFMNHSVRAHESISFSTIIQNKMGAKWIPTIKTTCKMVCHLTTMKNIFIARIKSNNQWLFFMSEVGSEPVRDLKSVGQFTHALKRLERFGFSFHICGTLENRFKKSARWSGY